VETAIFTISTGFNGCRKFDFRRLLVGLEFESWRGNEGIGDLHWRFAEGKLVGSNIEGMEKKVPNVLRILRNYGEEEFGV
jgi:hypothetical protein